jgi:hypothetical protein
MPGDRQHVANHTVNHADRGKGGNSYTIRKLSLGGGRAGRRKKDSGGMVGIHLRHVPSKALEVQQALRVCNLVADGHLVGALQEPQATSSLVLSMPSSMEESSSVERGVGDASKEDASGACNSCNSEWRSRIAAERLLLTAGAAAAAAAARSPLDQRQAQAEQAPCEFAAAERFSSLFAACSPAASMQLSESLMRPLPALRAQQRIGGAHTKGPSKGERIQKQGGAHTKGPSKTEQDQAMGRMQGPSKGTHTKGPSYHSSNTERDDGDCCAAYVQSAAEIALGIPLAYDVVLQPPGAHPAHIRSNDAAPTPTPDALWRLCM